MVSNQKTEETQSKSYNEKTFLVQLTSALDAIQKNEKAFGKISDLSRADVYVATLPTGEKQTKPVPEGVPIQQGIIEFTTKDGKKFIWNGTEMSSNPWRSNPQGLLYAQESSDTKTVELLVSPYTGVIYQKKGSVYFGKPPEFEKQKINLPGGFTSGAKEIEVNVQKGMFK